MHGPIMVTQFQSITQALALPTQMSPEQVNETFKATVTFGLLRRETQQSPHALDIPLMEHLGGVHTFIS